MLRWFLDQPFTALLFAVGYVSLIVVTFLEVVR